MNRTQPTQANSMHHQYLIYENPKIAKEFRFYYSHLHLQCLKFPIYPHNIHIEQEKHSNIWNTNKTIHAQIAGNGKLPFFKFFCLILKFFWVFLKEKTICLVKPVEKNPILNLVPGNGAKNLISPQAHGSVVTFQGRSHRDWDKLLGLYLPKFAKRIQIWDEKLKWQTNQSNDRNQEFTQIKPIPKPICQSTLFSFIGCFKTDDRCITTLFQGEVKYLN